LADAYQKDQLKTIGLPLPADDSAYKVVQTGVEMNGEKTVGTAWEIQNCQNETCLVRLVVDGEAIKVAHDLLRMARLSPNVLICLFKGDVAEFSIHEKPETIHFGFD